VKLSSNNNLVEKPQINADERRFVNFKTHQSSGRLHLRLNELKPVHNGYSEKWGEINL